MKDSVFSTTFNKDYQRIVGKSTEEVLIKTPKSSVDLFVADLLDGNHLIVLKALLDEVRGIKAKNGTAATSDIATSDMNSNAENGSDNAALLDNGASFEIDSHIPAYQMLHHELQNALYDAKKRIEEFEHFWTERLKPIELLPHLKKHDWIVAVEGGYKCGTEGAEEDIKNLYQLSVKDMVIEASRIVALADGAHIKLQVLVAKEWYSNIGENHKRLQPLLEAALRDKEAEIFKFNRLAIPNMMLKYFMDVMKKWPCSVFESEEKCLEGICSQWHVAGKTINGFHGFMLLTSQLAFEMIQLSNSYYDSKWRLFLRGIESASVSGPELISTEKDLSTQH